MIQNNTETKKPETIQTKLSLSLSPSQALELESFIKEQNIQMSIRLDAELLIDQLRSFGTLFQYVIVGIEDQLSSDDPIIGALITLQDELYNIIERAEDF